MKHRVVASLLALVMSIGFLPAREAHAKTVLDLEIHEAERFTDGAALVAKDGKWGAVNALGELIIPMEYDLPDEETYGGEFKFFHGGHAILVKDGKWGMFDNTGKLVIPFMYDWLTYFNDAGLALADRNGATVSGFVNKNGEETAGFENIIYDSANGMYQTENAAGEIGYYNESGELVFDYGTGVFGVHDGKGLMEKESDGQVLLTVVDLALNELAVVEGSAGHAGIGPVGLDEYDNFQMALNNKNKRGLLDRDAGKIVVPYKYATLARVSDGLAFAAEIPLDWDNPSQNRIGFISTSGQVVIPFEYTDASYFYGDGIAAVKNTEGKWALVNSQGGFLTQFIYDEIWLYDTLENMGAVIASREGKWGLLDPVTGVELTAFEYGRIDGFIGGYATVANGNDADGWLHGVIDTNGAQVLPVTNPGYIRPGAEYFWIQTDDGQQAIYTVDEMLAYAASFTENGEEIGADHLAEPSSESFGEIETAELMPELSGHVPGDILGDVLYSDIVAYINGSAIPTSITNGKTMVVVEDLRNYGFSVAWNADDFTLRVELNKNAVWSPLPVEQNAMPVGSFKTNYVFSTVRTYLSGELVESFAIDGRTLIDFELLAKYGSVVWDNSDRSLRLTIE
jgi:hypothetical protein